jgi:hypothetical protein
MDARLGEFGKMTFLESPVPHGDLNVVSVEINVR